MNRRVLGLALAVCAMASTSIASGVSLESPPPKDETFVRVMGWGRRGYQFSVSQLHRARHQNGATKDRRGRPYNRQREESRRRIQAQRLLSRNS